MDKDIFYYRKIYDKANDFSFCKNFLWATQV